MPVMVVRDTITRGALMTLARENFVGMVKGVGDLRRGVLAFGGESHQDGAAALLADGSSAKDLWGFCLYLDRPLAEAFEYRSHINVRPADGNSSVQIQKDMVRGSLAALVAGHVDWEK